MRHICRQIVGNNLKGEMALFSFPLPSGAEELRGAPSFLIWFKWLLTSWKRSRHTHDRIILTQCRTGRLTWHNGVIPASKVWIKIGSDKGGGSLNEGAPLYIYRYKDQITHLQVLFFF